MTPLAGAGPRRSGKERALIAVDQQGGLVVLATDGPWVAADCENVCPDADAIGLAEPGDCGTPGFYLWEGHGELAGGSQDDLPEAVYEGIIRPVGLAELAELYAMRPPPEAAPESAS